MDNTLTGFFLGCSSPSGFLSFFNELYSPHEGSFAYIIKGGPGTGKSTLMKKMSAELDSRGVAHELIFCSSDPDSLDGIIVPEYNCCIADGTAPHVIEPKYPGAAEQIVNLGDCWDKAALRERAKDIIRLTDENAACHRRCRRFLEAAAMLRGDIARLAAESVDEEKLHRFAARLSAREFGAPTGHIGEETHRFFSAPTPKGIMMREEKIAQLCDRVYLIEDENSAVTSVLMPLLRSYALSAGYDVISSPCPLSDGSEIEHIIIPKLRLAFLTENRYHTFVGAQTKRISAARFTDRAALRTRLSRLTFTKKACGEFIDEAVDSLKQAKQIHDELERLYITAMDFSQTDALAKELVDSMAQKK